jgi:hypothetical protein
MFACNVHWVMLTFLQFYQQRRIAWNWKQLGNDLQIGSNSNWKK